VPGTKQKTDKYKSSKQIDNYENVKRSQLSHESGTFFLAKILCHILSMVLI